MSFGSYLHRNYLNIATVLLVLIAVGRLGVSPELPAVVAFIVGGVLLAAIDWRVQRLPRRIVYLTLAGVAGGLVFAAIVERAWTPLLTAVAGALLFGNAFMLIWLVSTHVFGMRMIGLGDVRLAVVIGLLLGWWGLPAVLYGALVGHAFALLIAVVTSVRAGRLQPRYSFGPPLIAGALAVVLVAS